MTEPSKPHNADPSTPQAGPATSTRTVIDDGPPPVLTPSPRTVIDDGAPEFGAAPQPAPKPAPGHPAPPEPARTLPGTGGAQGRTVIDDGAPEFKAAPARPKATPTDQLKAPAAGATKAGVAAPRPGSAPTPGTVLGVGAPAPAVGLGEEPTCAADPSAGDSAPPATRAPAHYSGDRIQQYELIRELGRGGMGQVFLARDVKLGRKVAIKFLNTPSPRFTERFLVEARATARCNHENIVVIHEVNEHGGQPFMVLEYLEGDPLTELMAGNRLPPTRAIELIVPVIRALVRAHEFNIVHRDLKPDNIFVQRSGLIKVLDFGIAKLYRGEGDETPARAPNPSAGDLQPRDVTRDGAIVGTMAYMSPEQWGAAPVDHRTDIWAVGVLLYEMVAGEHPLAGLTPQQIMSNAALLDQPMPSVGEAVPDLPGDLERIIDRCLAKRKKERFASAQKLLDAVEPLVPTRYGRKLNKDESPYPGLTAFQETDAGRFFGRAKEITHAVTRIRDQPLLAVVGPSGVGKSSFIRAGVVPELKASGETWETFIVRPGRHPLMALASLLQPITRSSSPGQELPRDHGDLVDRLRREPGFLGTLLRDRARQKDSHILLFVDQFEELYTLGPDEAERRAYTAALAGVADDAATPLRVVVSMRSDFLDRAAEDQRFMEELSRGLVFLQSPDRQGLREAITQPLEMVGYHFDNATVVEEMLDTLEDTPGALPLLQFTAARLWETRDRRTHSLKENAFRQLGGVAGALATHADEVLAGLSASDRRLVHNLMLRLVTADGTRAIVDVSELTELSSTTGDVRRLVDHLVQARLLVVQTRGEAEGPAVELVHESLIRGWPRLRRWLDESKEDSAFLEQLRNAARQWQSRGQPQGLLWRGDTMQEARLWHRRYQGDLSRLEARYLDAVFALAARATRRRRAVVIGIIAFLILLVVAAGFALISVRRAEQTARKNETQARAAEAKVKRQLRLIQQKEREKQAAQSEASQAKKQVVTKDRDLKKKQQELNLSYEQLKEALKKARKERDKAEAERTRAEKATHTAREALTKARIATKRAEELAAAERKARAQMKTLLDRQAAKLKRLLRERKKITTTLR